jgi:hypothetical protein
MNMMVNPTKKLEYTVTDKLYIRKNIENCHIIFLLLSLTTQKMVLQRVHFYKIFAIFKL